MNHCLRTVHDRFRLSRVQMNIKKLLVKKRAYSSEKTTKKANLVLIKVALLFIRERYYN